MTSGEIKRRFLHFFKNREHEIIPSASLVPDNDPSVLFTTAGMQPLVPYLLGEVHPKGNRLVNVQKCVRTTDIEEVGDATHLTFFQMLGNWSLGDYFKKEAIAWSYEFLTDKEEGLGLDPNRLYVTVFEGDENAPRDIESVEIWKSLGVPEHRIYFRGEDNWWSPGPNGPCGPSSEMFYDLTEEGLGDMTSEEFEQADEKQKVVEIWNDVFMEYEKKNGEVAGKLSQKNVDTGAGLERMTAVLQGVRTAFDTDLFTEILESIHSFAQTENVRSERIVADHVRSSVFMIGDGVEPSNTDRGYIVRRLLRRAVRHADSLGIPEGRLRDIALVVIDQYGTDFKEVEERRREILEIIQSEEEKFRKTLAKGLRELERLGTSNISGKDAFNLFTTYGFPIELTVEIAAEQGHDVDVVEFEREMEAHRQTSRLGSGEKFKGGLADTSEMSVRYHTATHLLNAALREVLGDHVEQRGSNITPERLRFDFSHDEKLTDEEKQKVEDWVNDKIQQGLPVSSLEMSLEEAKEKGALGVFEDKYADTVKVYTIGDDKRACSREICGGPHVENTSELGHFKITKEESAARGVRRIKAVLE